jgi:bacterioferritin-associated ferredoxin
MIICNCAAVGHAAICKAVDEEGLRTVKQLQQKFNVANQCRKCAIAAKTIITLVLAAKAANKKAGIEAPVQLDIKVMLEAIAAAEKAKHSDTVQTKGVRKSRVRACSANTCQCGKSG